MDDNSWLEDLILEDLRLDDHILPDADPILSDPILPGGHHQDQNPFIIPVVDQHHDPNPGDEQHQNPGVGEQHQDQNPEQHQDQNPGGQQQKLEDVESRAGPLLSQEVSQEGTQADEVAQGPMPRILFGVTETHTILELGMIILNLQQFADVIVVSTTKALNLVDRSNLQCKVLSDIDGISTLLGRGRFLYEDLLDWASHVVVLANGDLICKVALGRSDDLLCMLVNNFTNPVLMIPDMPLRMWLSPTNMERVDQLRGRGNIVLDRLVGQPPYCPRIVERVLQYID